MAQTPKNPNVERVADIPFEKDDVSPVPQYAPRTRAAGAGATESAPPASSSAPHPHREEYPGPQTSSSGERAEPGRRPTTDGAASDE